MSPSNLFWIGGINKYTKMGEYMNAQWLRSFQKCKYIFIYYICIIWVNKHHRNFQAENNGEQQNRKHIGKSHWSFLILKKNKYND